MAFRIIRNDITKVKADAIVNTANPHVAVGSGVDTAIYNAAGRERLFAEREKIGEMAPGEVAITPAFDLDAKYIIHAVGPMWEDGDSGEAELLRQCYDKSLFMAYENGCESIAFPLMATGAYRFPKKQGMQIAVDAFTAFLEDHEMEITLVVFGDDTVKISGDLVDEVDSFIDEGYERRALKAERGAVRSLLSGAGRAFGAATAPGFYGSKAYRKSEDSSVDEFRDSRGVIEEEEESADLAESKVRMMASVTMPDEIRHPEDGTTDDDKSLDDVLKGIYTDSFEKHLQKIINKKGLKNSEVYAAANISKQYFSKLLKGQVKPSKEKVLALAVGLRLNLDETVDFLRLAGYALSPISQTDAVVQYFIKRKDYNVIKINFVLFDYGLDELT